MALNSRSVSKLVRAEFNLRQFFDKRLEISRGFASLYERTSVVLWCFVSVTNRTLETEPISFHAFPNGATREYAWPTNGKRDEKRQRRSRTLKTLENFPSYHRLFRSSFAPLSFSFRIYSFRFSIFFLEARKVTCNCTRNDSFGKVVEPPVRYGPVTVIP